MRNYEADPLPTSSLLAIQRSFRAELSLRGVRLHIRLAYLCTERTLDPLILNGSRLYIEYP